MSFKVESNEIKQSQDNTLTGNGTHISIVPLAPNSHAQIHIQLAPILIITPLNTSGMIRPRHLQQPHTSLDPIHDKVSPELVLFLFGAYQLGSSQSVQMTSLTHTHDGQHSEVSREAQNAARYPSLLTKWRQNSAAERAEYMMPLMTLGGGGPTMVTASAASTHGCLLGLSRRCVVMSSCDSCDGGASATNY